MEYIRSWKYILTKAVIAYGLFFLVVNRLFVWGPGLSLKNPDQYGGAPLGVVESLTFNEHMRLAISKPFLAILSPMDLTTNSVVARSPPAETATNPGFVIVLFFYVCLAFLMDRLILAWGGKDD